jgi:CRP-like cAMP-binding protein
LEDCLLKEFLRTVPLFSDLPGDQLDRLARLFREERFPAYHLVYREGDPVDAFYVVREGMVTIFRDEQGSPQQILARLEQGGFFGEMGVLNDKARRIASARTASPAVLLRIDKADLVPVLMSNPGLELKLRAEVIRRHGMNVSALLGLAGQRDVRIRLGVDAILRTEDGRRLAVILENLSLGGVGLSRVPNNWQTGHLVRFHLGTPREPDLLHVSGTVTWREADNVGIAFGPEAAGNAPLIHRALRRFLNRP